jgi:resuscitation-promoting factor RpfB
MRWKIAGLLFALGAAGCEVETGTRVEVGRRSTTPAESDTLVSTIPFPPPPPLPPPAPPPPAFPTATAGCDPNYDPCVPIASDVDCAGGSGNGPAYADGPVRVIGRDVYALDRDGDGIACDG